MRRVLQIAFAVLFALCGMIGCLAVPADLPKKAVDVDVNTTDTDAGESDTEPSGDADGTDTDTTIDPDTCVPREWFQDNDGDGFGDPSVVMESCRQPPGHITDNTDCDDDADTAHPSGIEAGYDGRGDLVDQCDDGIDNDCNGDVDEADEACADSDEDGSPDAVDPIFTMDADGDGNHETLCIVSAYVMPDGVWTTSDAIYQGDEGTTGNSWGGYDVLDTSQSDAYDADLGAWCHDFTDETAGAGAVSYIYRYVSTILSDGQTSTGAQDCPPDLIVMDVTDYCTSYSDPYCKTVFSTDGCGDSIGWVVRILWDGTEISD